jgi:DNA-binding transcriptional regulator LsrR (DeoR family)
LSLRSQLGLDVVVVEESASGEDRRDAAIRGAARYLDATRPSRIGVGWGMSLRRLPAAVASRRDDAVQVFEAIGHGAWWAPEDGPFDIAGELAARYDGRAWHVAAPVFADTAEAARVYLADPAVARVLAGAMSADVVLVGPSTADPETSSLVLAGGLTREEMAKLRSRGAVGDVIGQFYDAEGRPIDTALDTRTVRLSLAQLRAANVVAIAAGSERLRSIAGAVHCGLVKGLITDERTAAELATMLVERR